MIEEIHFILLLANGIRTIFHNDVVVYLHVMEYKYEIKIFV